MTALDISQFELVDPAPAGQLILAPAAARTAAGQSMSGLSAGRRPEFDVMRGFVVAGLVVFHSARAARTVTAEGQPACPFCDPLGGRFSGPLCRLPAWAGWPMKSSSAWLTSSAWVQMIACGPPAMTMERALFSNAGSLLPVAS